MSVTPGKSSFRRIAQRLLVGGMLLVIGGWLIDTYLLQGLFLPVRIAGGSMAPHSQGDHWRVTCSDCRRPFSVGAEMTTEHQLAVCPNCGFRENDLRQATLTRGDRVLLDKLTPALRSPRRWDLIAVRSPLAEGELAIKRVVGLPGEQVEIRAGEILIDGALLRKPLDIAQQVSVPLYDDRFRARAPQLPPRWQADRADTRWQTNSNGYTYQSQQAPPPPETSVSPLAVDYDWLTYRQLTCLQSPRPRSDETPVMDTYGWNQGLSRAIYPVDDLLLSGQLRLTPGSRLAWSLHDGRDVLLVEVVPSGANPAQFTVICWQNETELARHDVPVALTTSTRFTVATCDQQLLLRLGAAQPITCRYTPSNRPRQPTSRPLGIGAVGPEVEVSELAICRDLYYLGPHGNPAPWSLARPLASGELFLLGDNVPVSVDSRNWTSAADAAPPQLLGRVLSLR